jgi:fructoselysine/glucoselysine PTS system EIIA component
MVKIMLASHGNLAAGMLSSAEMVFGKQDNVSVICAKYLDYLPTHQFILLNDCGL